jgi:uncharacterized glyoxalase superfamily protein PhnB
MPKPCPRLLVTDCGLLPDKLSSVAKPLLIWRTLVKCPVNADGKAIHAELTLRGATLMLGPEMPQMGSRAAKTIGASPTSLYLLTENVDKAVAKAVKLGAVPKGPVMDMFWGDRCGTVVDPEGYTWMIATHIALPTPKEMQQKMKEQMASQQAARAASGS